MLGVRWEYYGSQHNKNGALDSNYYTPGNTADLSGTALAQQIAAGISADRQQEPDWAISGSLR